MLLYLLGILLTILIHCSILSLKAYQNMFLKPVKIISIPLSCYNYMGDSFPACFGNFGFSLSHNKSAADWFSLFLQCQALIDWSPFHVAVQGKQKSVHNLKFSNFSKFTPWHPCNYNEKL